MLDVHPIVDKHKYQVGNSDRHQCGKQNDGKASPVTAEKGWEETKEKDRPRKPNRRLFQLASVRIFKIYFCVCQYLFSVSFCRRRIRPVYNANQPVACPNLADRLDFL